MNGRAGLKVKCSPGPICYVLMLCKFLVGATNVLSVFTDSAWHRAVGETWNLIADFAWFLLVFIGTAKCTLLWASAEWDWLFPSSKDCYGYEVLSFAHDICFIYAYRNTVQDWDLSGVGWHHTNFHGDWNMSVNSQKIIWGPKACYRSMQKPLVAV